MWFVIRWDPFGWLCHMLNFIDSTISVRAATHSVDKDCYIRSDDSVYDKGFLDAFKIEGYGYAQVANEIADFYVGSASSSSVCQQVQETTGRQND